MDITALLPIGGLAGANATDIGLLILALCAAGLFAGLIGGLFGVGGGTVLVPVLFALFTLFEPGSEVSLHVAVATSLTTIISTSLRSVSAHRQRGAVDEEILRGFLPWIALGALLGSGLAAMADRAVLGLVYGVLAALVGGWLAAFGPEIRLLKAVPTGQARAFTGTGIGIASAMMGIGGGMFGSTMMTLAGRSMHQAVATASGFGVAIAIPATLGFVLAGWGEAGRPPLSLGYVNVPGAILLAALTSISAPWGAALAHKLDRTKLRKLFGFYLIGTACLVLVKALI